MTRFLACLVFVVFPASSAIAEQGIASVYSSKQGSGQRTACGPRLNDSAMMAAHKTLPCGSRARVTHTRNGKSIVVTIVDRGPFIRGRVIDLTIAGANALGFGWGIAPVNVQRE